MIVAMKAVMGVGRGSGRGIAIRGRNLLGVGLADNEEAEHNSCYEGGQVGEVVR